MPTLESIVTRALSGLADDKVYPDLAPGGTDAPWIVYTTAGGQSWAYLRSNPNTTRNARVQISVWSQTRKETSALMEQVYQALVNPSVKAVPLGAPVNAFESDTLLYGAHMDFSVTYSQG